MKYSKIKQYRLTNSSKQFLISNGNLNCIPIRRFDDLNKCHIEGYRPGSVSINGIKGWALTGHVIEIRDDKFLNNFK